LNFTPDCAVDFGTVAAQKVEYKTPLQIVATSPAGFGLVNVTVTNNIGTSAATPSAAFAFGGPTPVAGTVSPASGTGGAALKIQDGRGLKGATSVVFIFPGGMGEPPNLVPANNFRPISDSEIDFAAPALSGLGTAPLSVNVAVTFGDIFLPIGSFIYTS
jgi:hypothetical protein